MSFAIRLEQRAHLPHRLVQPHPERAADDGKTDVQLFDLRELGDRAYIIIVQSMAGGHCQLEPTPDGLFVLSDLGSSNGTIVNQEKIAGRKVLLGGEYIQIGDCLFRFADS